MDEDYGWDDEPTWDDAYDFESALGSAGWGTDEWYTGGAEMIGGDSDLLGEW